MAKEAREAGMFSVQIDTTHDITSKHQCCVIVRSVSDVVHERLLAVVDCQDSSGKAFVKLLKQVLDNDNLNIKIIS